MLLYSELSFWNKALCIQTNKQKEKQQNLVTLETNVSKAWFKLLTKAGNPEYPVSYKNNDDLYSFLWIFTPAFNFNL